MRNNLRVHQQISYFSHTHIYRVRWSRLSALPLRLARVMYMTVLGVVLAVAALVVLVSGSLAWTRRLPGNPYIGIRVPEVRKSQEVWQSAHLVAGPLWTIGGVAMLMGSMLFIKGSGWLYAVAALAVIAGVMLVSVGANVGARAASLIDAQQDVEDAAESTCCSSGNNPAPAVDVDAIRRAAHSADNTSDS
ncbi:SdpI family protein [Corynebacterium diphtheriae bv. mitis]|nr:SdpI family protein [Corynebacterium diphtheriae]MBG9274094.1 SdpI family protein [Corynebacterium diphtheriae bv. mitis]